MQCYSCQEKGRDTYHFNEDGPCPVCNSGAFMQVFHPDSDEIWNEVPENHPHVIQAVYESRIRNIRSTLKNMPYDVLCEALKIIEKEMQRHHQVTHIKIDDSNPVSYINYPTHYRVEIKLVEYDFMTDIAKFIIPKWDADKIIQLSSIPSHVKSSIEIGKTDFHCMALLSAKSINDLQLMLWENE